MLDSELASAMLNTKRELQRLQQVEKRFLDASYTFQTTVVEKQFYDSQASIHRASIPKVVSYPARPAFRRPLYLKC